MLRPADMSFDTELLVLSAASGSSRDRSHDGFRAANTRGPAVAIGVTIQPNGVHPAFQPDLLKLGRCGKVFRESGRNRKT